MSRSGLDQISAPTKITWATTRLDQVTRLRHALDILHWSSVALAGELGVNERTVRRWMNGQNAAPVGLVGWLEDLAGYHAAHRWPEAAQGGQERAP